MGNESIKFVSSPSDRLSRHMLSHCVLIDHRGDTPNEKHSWLDGFGITLALISVCLQKKEAQCIPCFYMFFPSHHSYYRVLKRESHLFECELELGRVKQDLEQDLGVVLGVIEHLFFHLTQSLVVWVIGCKKLLTEQTEDDYRNQKIL